MKKLTTLCLLLFLWGWGTLLARQPEQVASVDNLRIKGILMYDNDKSVETLGLYSYSATNPIIRQQLTSIPRVYANGGSIIYNGKLFTYSYDVQYGFVNSARYYTYDIETGEELSSTSVGYDIGVAYSHAATSSALDPVSSVVYCSGYKYDETQETLSVKLKTWNLETNSKNTVADMTAPLIAMAFDNEGQLWGITASSSTTSTDGGFLVKVNKENGEQTLVGDTGVRPYYDQSAVFDNAHGVFYWLANTQTEEANLYIVDLTTGKATLVGALPNGDEVVAPFINAQEFEDTAPSAPVNISTKIVPDYSVALSFDMPTSCYDGSKLDGGLSWSATAMGAETVTKTGIAEAGNHVTVNFDMESSGTVEFKVSAKKNEISGPVVTKEVYVGYDRMNAPSNVALVNTDTVNTLTWDAPTEGHFGGLLATEGLRYLIKRMPDNIVVADAHESTVYTETVEDDNLRNTYYIVSAVNGDVIGDEAKSNSVMTGSSITPPYNQDFEQSDALSLYTIVDANTDDNTWYYSVKSAKYRQSTSQKADDYLFMPAFNLKKGYSYELTFDGYGTNTRYNNTIDVVIASEPTASAAVALNSAPITYNNDSRSIINNKITVVPEADGKYYIGFHISSEKSQGTFTIDNVTLSEGKSSAVPDTANNLSASAAALGSLAVSIQFNAPETTVAGNPLGEEVLLSYSVSRNETEIATGKATAGVLVSVDDKDVPTDGNYKYSVAFSNAHGIGETVSTEIYVGIDSPAAPMQVILTDNNNGTGKVEWTPAEKGVNQGYVDAKKAIYTILDQDGSVLKTGIKDTFSEIALDNNGEQRVFSVKVAVGYVDNATVPATTSNEVLAGAPYTLPFRESFADAKTTTSPWIKEVVSGKSYDTSWSARADCVNDNDGGAADMTAYDAAASRWASPKIDISSVADPKVSLWVNLPDNNSRFTLQLQQNNGEWKDLCTIEEATNDWKHISVPLTAYSEKNVRLGLLGESLGGMQFVYVDNITISSDEISGTNDIDALNHVSVIARNCNITIVSETAIAVAIYTPEGRCVASTTCTTTTIPVNHGIYIVKIASSSLKVAL